MLFQGLMVLAGIALLSIIFVGFVKGDSVKPNDTRRGFPVEVPAATFRTKRS